jgi:2,3-bisphosphoglycerate-dependent phosphoglycerate mutase
MNKHQIKDAIGEEAFNELRRSYDSPVEGGESLERVYQRVMPFYLRVILPRLRHGQNILVVAHGNSIRSLVKYIENISDNEIGDVEMIQNEILEYSVDNEGRATHKETLQLEESA